MLWMNWVIFYIWNIPGIPSHLILNCMKKLVLNLKIKFSTHEENIMMLWKGENPKTWMHFFPSKDNFCFWVNWKEGKLKCCILLYLISVFKRLKYWYRFASPGDLSFLRYFWCRMNASIDRLAKVQLLLCPLSMKRLQIVLIVTEIIKFKNLIYSNVVW